MRLAKVTPKMLENEGSWDPIVLCGPLAGMLGGNAVGSLDTWEASVVDGTRAPEKPVVGARLYLANGQSVITDSEGMYNLPAVTEGAQVISIDPITLPDGYLLGDNNRRSGKNWARLLRTPLGGGAMLRQNSRNL